MEPKPDIADYQGEKGKGKTCSLPDGRFITVFYDDNGEIEAIYTNHDTTTETRSSDNKAYNHADIGYRKDVAEYNIDSSKFGYEGKITSGYDFEKLKALAEKIFGKPETTEE